MSAGSDHEPTIDPNEVAEQVRAASERLRDQVRIVAAVSRPSEPVLRLDDESNT